MFAALTFVLVAQELTVRTSSVDVLPPEQLALGGYTARAGAKFEDGGERLFARTAVFSQGKRTVAVVSFESLTVPESLVREVKSRVPTNVDLMLVATHTHSAPDSQMLNDRMTFKVPGIAAFSRRWLGWYADRIASGINAALNSAQTDATKLELLQAKVESNRGRREGADPDQTATWAVLGRKPILTMYAAHGTLYDEKRLQLSGDWPGAYALRAGGLVLPGPIGDVSPAYPTKNPVENLSLMVDNLESNRALAEVTELWPEGACLAYHEQEIRLDKVVAHPGFAEEYGVSPPLDQVVIGRFAPKDASVSLLLLGKLLIVGVPGEPTSEVGRKVQVLAQSMGFLHSVVVSHCNGWMGYVLEPDDYDKGGYEATLSFHGREASLRVLEAVEVGLSKLVSGSFAATSCRQG